ncbi:MAG: alpha/beta fold hydrolase [Planctomycetota bacterium]
MTAVAPRDGATRNEVVWRRGPACLRRYQAPAGAPARLPIPVLLVPSIINRPTILDLAPGQSVVEHLLGQGLDVFLLDWGEPTQADAHLDLDAYAGKLLPRALEAACRAAGAPAAHLLGYCLGGTFALIAAAAKGRQVASVIALTTPVDLTEPGPMGVLVDQRLVDLEKAMAFPIVPGAALWAAFQALDPTGNARKARTLFERRDDEDFRERFVAQEGWLNDPIAMTARALRDVVGRLYRENALARGTFALQGRPLRLGAGTAPVLNLVAERDTIVPASAARAIAGLWGGPVETVSFDAGHIGVTVGSKAPQDMWRVVSEWLRARQDPSA